MLTETIAVVGLIVALIATASSAWQAYLTRTQLKKTTAVDKAVFYQNLTRDFSLLNRIFIERPDLRPYFYDGKSTDDPILKHQLLAIAGYIGDTAEGCIAAEEVLPHLKGDWDAHFNFFYRNSPALREWWQAMGHFYPPEVARAVLGPPLRPKQPFDQGVASRPGDADSPVELRT